MDRFSPLCDGQEQRRWLSRGEAGLAIPSVAAGSVGNPLSPWRQPLSPWDPVCVHMCV